jgi:hypothetical protein
LVEAEELKRMRPVTLKGHKRLRGALNFFELILVDSQRNVYRGELEVRPPGAPTTAGRSGKAFLFGHGPNRTDVLRNQE